MTVSSFFKSTALLGMVAFGLLAYNFIQASWTAPTATPPGGNTDRPINVGSIYQAKSGDLGAIRMRAGQYCNAAGTKCFTADQVEGLVKAGGTVTPPGGTPTDILRRESGRATIATESYGFGSRNSGTRAKPVSVSFGKSFTSVPMVQVTTADGRNLVDAPVAVSRTGFIVTIPQDCSTSTHGSGEAETTRCNPRYTGSLNWNVIGN